MPVIVKIILIGAISSGVAVLVAILLRRGKPQA